MPLLKRKPYILKLPPRDLRPDEFVYQVRFTKEIFRDYEEYLEVVNLYRRRIWMCKVTGKQNLTFEEALVSEHKATEKVQRFPKLFMGPVLSMVQFSSLRIDELVDRIYKDFKDCLVVSEEGVGKYGDTTCSCKILKILQQQDVEAKKYEVAWMDDHGKKIGTSIEPAENINRRKPPFSRVLLKAFIRESSTSGPSRNSFWIVHNKLARKYKISVEPPGMPVVQAANKKKDKHVKVEVVENGAHKARKRKQEGNKLAAQDKKVAMKGRCSFNFKICDNKQAAQNKKVVKKVLPPEHKPIRYPIEDSLLEPTAVDASRTERPMISTDFVLPMECIGKALMIWDFCCSFGKVLHLSPFTIEEFEKSLDYREGNTPVLVEIHFSLLRTALSDASLHEEFGKKRKRRAEVAINTWADDLSDFLDMTGLKTLGRYSLIIRGGNYKELETASKLEILLELVDRSLSSSIIRSQLDENIEEMQAISARKREAEAEGSKRRKQERLKHGSMEKENAGLEANGVGRETGKAENATGSGDEHDVFMPLDQVVKIENGRPEEAGHAIGWKTKGKRKSAGNHSPVTANGHLKEDNKLHSVAVSKSRQEILKQKEAKRLAEEQEKEKKRSEGKKKLQEKKKGQADALAERKFQEQFLIESQKKQEHLDRELEKRSIRTSPLGKDCVFNVYWFFNREGRLFVECKDSNKWGYYSAKEELDALYQSLNPKGIREKALQKQMEKHYAKISNALQRRSKEMAQKMAMEEAVVRRSVRVRSAPRLVGFLAYTNKLRTTCS